MLFWKKTRLSLWRATEGRWNKSVVSLVSCAMDDYYSDSDSLYWTCSQKAKNQKAKQIMMHCTTIFNIVRCYYCHCHLNFLTPGGDICAVSGGPYHVIKEFNQWQPLNRPILVYFVWKLWKLSMLMPVSMFGDKTTASNRSKKYFTAKPVCETAKAEYSQPSHFGEMSFISIYLTVRLKKMPVCNLALHRRCQGSWYLRERFVRSVTRRRRVWRPSVDAVHACRSCGSQRGVAGGCYHHGRMRAPERPRGGTPTDAPHGAGGERDRRAEGRRLEIMKTARATKRRRWRRF